MPTFDTSQLSWHTVCIAGYYLEPMSRHSEKEHSLSSEVSGNMPERPREVGELSPADSYFPNSLQSRIAS